jgi:hypothetical protein
MRKRLYLVLFFTGFLKVITFAQWSAPVDISPGAVSAGLNESMGSCLGVSNNTLHVVWCNRFSTNRGAIYYTHSADTGSTWSTPIPISNTNGNAWNPAIAVNGLNIHVVWREIDSVNNHRSSHYCHSLDGGITWGINIVLDTVVADWPAVAVAGDKVYVANDIVTSQSPYNTEIFFFRSTDNGNTWSPHQQLTFADGRSEDEAITAQGSDIHMAWNDNRYNNKMRIFYKHSPDYGLTWDADDTLAAPFGYGTMVSADSIYVDVPYAGAPTGHYQIHIVQSADNGANWGTDRDLTQNTDTTYYYPFIVRDGSDIHLTYVKAFIGGQYLHSGDGGATWDAPYTFFAGSIGITAFTAYTGCTVHIIYLNNTDHHIYYLRNPTGNTEHCAIITDIAENKSKDNVSVYPNPASDKINLQIPQQFVQTKTLEIFDCIGQLQLIRSEDFSEIDISSLAKGLYFIVLTNGDNERMVSKIIKE